MKNPCTHATVGTVSAGDIDDPSCAHCRVSTCIACVPKSQRHVERHTGQPASVLRPYPPNEQHHAERDESRTALHAMTEWDHAATQPDHGLIKHNGRWEESW